jgi:hypothetical protein
MGSSKILLAAVCKCPDRAWSDADVIALVNFRSKSLLVIDLNAGNAVWNSQVSNSRGEKILDVTDNFEIPAPKHHTHYTPEGTGDVSILWLVEVSDRQMSLSLTFCMQITFLTFFQIVDHIRVEDNSNIVEILIGWEPRLLLESGEEADKAARDFTASVDSAYGLSERTLTLRT